MAKYPKDPEARNQAALDSYYRNREKRLLALRQSTQEIKKRVIDAYGGTCARCAFSDLRALSIDHIEGGGGKHRKELGHSGGRPFYRWLEEQGLPAGFQVLCMNCQWIKKAENGEFNQTGRPRKKGPSFEI